MAAYFALTALVVPQLYSGAEINEPRPRIDVLISSDQISLGQSFDVTVRSHNDGGTADMQTVSVAFPSRDSLEEISITSYDFMQSPILIEAGEEIGSEYTAGEVTVTSQYSAIEAYSRPSHPGDTFTMILKVTPKEAGPFHVYAKSVAMPHLSDKSHFPDSGILDHQNEFVQQYVVEVSR